MELVYLLSRFKILYEKRLNYSFFWIFFFVFVPLFEDFLKEECVKNFLFQKLDMMKMDNLTETEFSDFSVMFEKICALTSSSISPSKNNRGRRVSSVSPRMPLKRGESQPNGMSANQRRLRFREFSQVG